MDPLTGLLYRYCMPVSSVNLSSMVEFDNQHDNNVQKHASHDETEALV